MSELSDLLVRALPDGWSRRQVAREARKLGFNMSDATATAYLGGRHGVPDDETIAAFAAVLRVSERMIRSAAGVTAAGTPWTPPRSSRYLRDDQRAALEQLISTMVERSTEESDGDVHRTAAPNQTADEDRDNNLDDLKLDVSWTTDALVIRYVSQAKGDLALALRLLLHDGAKGAGVPVSEWDEAVEELERHANAAAAFNDLAGRRARSKLASHPDPYGVQQKAAYDDRQTDDEGDK